MRHQNNFSAYNGIEINQVSRFTGLPYELYNDRVEMEKPYLINAVLADRITKAVAIVSLFTALFFIGLNA